MSFLSKVAGGFSKALGGIFGGPGDLNQLRQSTYNTEYRRLREIERLSRRDAIQLQKEGVGRAEETNVTLGYQKDDNLSQAEKDFRAYGDLPEDPTDTGLIL